MLGSRGGFFPPYKTFTTLCSEINQIPCSVAGKKGGGEEAGCVATRAAACFLAALLQSFAQSLSPASPQMFSLLCASLVFTVQGYGGGGNILPIVQ